MFNFNYLEKNIINTSKLDLSFINSLKEKTIINIHEYLNDYYESNRILKNDIKNIEIYTEALTHSLLLYNVIEQYGLSKSILELCDTTGYLQKFGLENDIAISVESLSDVPIFGKEQFIALEGIKSFFTSIWEAIKRFFAKLFKSAETVKETVTKVIKKQLTENFEKLNKALAKVDPNKINQDKLNFEINISVNDFFNAMADQQTSNIKVGILSFIKECKGDIEELCKVCIGKTSFNNRNFSIIKDINISDKELTDHFGKALIDRLHNKNYKFENNTIIYTFTKSNNKYGPKEWSLDKTKNCGAQLIKHLEEIEKDSHKDTTIKRLKDILDIINKYKDENPNITDQNKSLLQKLFFLCTSLSTIITKNYLKLVYQDPYRLKDPWVIAAKGYIEASKIKIKEAETEGEPELAPA
jgi:hypothetical protein